MKYETAEVLAKLLVNILKDYSDEKRLEIINIITNEYCEWCGGRAPCRCTDDT